MSDKLIIDVIKIHLSTHKGLFRYMRLPYRVALAPAIFQRAVEGLLQDALFTGVLIDKILVSGVNNDDHLKNLGEVPTR